MSDSALTPMRRVALPAMVALGAVASLVLLNEIHVGPAWVQWAVSLVALAAGLGVIVIGDLSWQRAVANAEADGLVAGPESESSR